METAFSCPVVWQLLSCKLLQMHCDTVVECF